MNTADKVLTRRQAALQAADFMKQYYEKVKDHQAPITTYSERLKEVLTKLGESGTYNLTQDELTKYPRGLWDDG